MSESVGLECGAEVVKTEAVVKPECEACVVCGAAACGARVAAGAGDVLREYAIGEMQATAVCGACLELLQLLETARQHYLRLRDALERLLAPNPRFRVPPAPAPASAAPDLARLKEEPEDHLFENAMDMHFEADSDNEPLLLTKKKRHDHKSGKKKKIRCTKSHKRKQSWEDDELKADEFILPDPDVPLMDIAVKLEDNHLESQNSNSGLTEAKNGRLTAATRKAMGAQRSRGRPRKAESESLRAGAKPIHACDQCDSKFSTLGRLQQHIRRHAAGRGPFICEVCGAHYKHRRACDVHIAMHRGISDWKCTPCNKLFPSKGALQRHNNIHTGQLNYQCEECGKSFIHTSSFKMHALTHSGVKPHKCGVCGLGLLTSSHLKRHLRVHSGEKRYACPVCGKRFSERYNLAAHSKSHEPAPQAAPAPAAPAAPGSPARAPFRCAFCNERFPRKYLLERHCGAAHGRPLERAAPRPRNTMSKLLKARAAEKQAAVAPPTEACVKEDPSPPASCGDAPADPTAVPTAECGSQAALGSWGLPYRH